MSTKKRIKQQCEALAREHGVELTWMQKTDEKTAAVGYYIPNTNKIAVTDGTARQIACIFCHEMGHVFNFRNKKYYKYHRFTGKRYTRRFKTKHRAVDYALKAEIYTDKVGRRLCKKWFPDITFKANYKYNEEFYSYMYLKFFGGYYIIFMT